MELDVEGFKERWQLNPEQLKHTKLSPQELEISQNMLFDFEDMIIQNIADWALDESFFLYHDEEDLICRFFQFSKGLSKCFIIINTKPEIMCTNEEMDCELLMNISNMLLDFMHDCYEN